MDVALTGLEQLEVAATILVIIMVNKFRCIACMYTQLVLGES